MPSDQLLTEQLFTLKELSRKINVRRCYSTVRRWAVDGSAGANGEVVRLETVLVGGSRHSSLEAYRRFLKAMAGT